MITKGYIFKILPILAYTKYANGKDNSWYWSKVGVAAEAVQSVNL